MIYIYKDHGGEWVLVQTVADMMEGLRWLDENTVVDDDVAYVLSPEKKDEVS